MHPAIGAPIAVLSLSSFFSLPSSCRSARAVTLVRDSATSECLVEMVTIAAGFHKARALLPCISEHVERIFTLHETVPLGVPWPPQIMLSGARPCLQNWCLLQAQSSTNSVLPRPEVKDLQASTTCSQYLKHVVSWGEGSSHGTV